MSVDPRRAREKLFADYYRLIGVIARKFAWMPDIRQVGALGLWKACLSYDPAKGEFLTFAWAHIHGAISHYVRDTRYTHRSRRDRRCTHEYQPCPDRTRCQGHPRPRDAEFVEGVHDPVIQWPEETMVDSLALREVLQDLSRKQQIALLLHVGYEMRQVDVARHLHYSQRRVSRLVHSGLKKARKAAQRRGYIH